MDYMYVERVDLRHRRPPTSEYRLLTLGSLGLSFSTVILVCHICRTGVVCKYRFGLWDSD